MQCHQEGFPVCSSGTVTAMNAELFDYCFRALIAML